MARRDWIKVRSGWWTDPDHAKLSGHVLCFGVFLLYLADSDPDWRETGRGRLLGGRGVALGLSDVCARVGIRLRDGRRWVNALVDAGTLSVDSDGTYFFPNYAKHQEDPSSKRKRKQRDNRVTITPHVTVEEEEEQKKNRGRSNLTSKVAPPKRRATRAKTPPGPDECEVAQYMYDAIRSHNPEFLSGMPPAKITAKLDGWARDIGKGMRNDGMTVAGCKLAIDAAHRSADTFWRANLLSGTKLRKHYEALRIRKAANDHDPNDPTAWGIDYDDFGDKLDAMCGLAPSAERTESK